MNENITDIHMHVIPDVDDGAVSFEMSMEMLQSAYSQGVRAVICTPHGGCFYHRKTRLTVKRNYRKLCEISQMKFPDLKLFPGAEVRFIPDLADKNMLLLKKDQMPTLAGSKYVLTEFSNHGMTFGNALYSIQELLDSGFIPVIAHMERYPDLFDINTATRIREMGCLIQINACSITSGASVIGKERTFTLLQEKLVDFIGSDGHNMSNRTPDISDGVRVLFERYDDEYVRKIISDNANNLLLFGSGANPTKFRK